MQISTLKCNDKIAGVKKIREGCALFYIHNIRYIISFFSQIMIIIHLALWIGANYYTLRLLRVEPKDNQNAGNYPLSSAPHNTRYNPETSRNADAGRNDDGGSRVNTGHQVDANRPRNRGELQINNDHQENGTLQGEEVTNENFLIG